MVRIVSSREYLSMMEYSASLTQWLENSEPPVNISVSVDAQTPTMINIQITPNR